MATPNAPQPDLQALALTKAIRQHESGGNYSASGDNATSTGAYQFQAPTWKSYSKQILGDENAQMTPENQNAVAYGMIKTWKDQGLGPAQIAAKWNSGSETGWENKVGTTTRNGKDLSYNVPQYVSSVVSNFKQIYPQVQQQYGGQTAGTDNTIPQTPPSSSGPAFPYAEGDNGLTAGAKAIGNLPGSAAGFVGGVAQGFNPLHALNNIGDIASGFSDLAGSEGHGKAFLDVLKGLPEAAYQSLVPQGIRSLLSGDTKGAAEAFTNDPFGQAAPAVFAAIGGAKLADNLTGGSEAALKAGKPITVSPKGEAVLPQGKYSSAVDSAISGVGGPVADTLAKPFSAGAGLVGGLTRSLASHLTSLNPETISQVVADPKSFSKIAQDQVSRGSIFESVKSGLNDLQSAYAENGKLYKGVRSGETSASVPENFIGDVLAKSGLKLENGQVVADTKSLTRDTGDIKALQHFVDNWEGKTNLTPDEFLNMRQDIGKIAKFGKEIGSNRGAATVAKELYAEANRTVRPQIKGLKALDESSSPQIELIKRVKKDLLTADGQYKDNAPSKIVNSLNKEGLLSRLEQLRPGISKQLQILKAVEDIERAKGIKVGGYTRAAVEGFGAVTGNIPAVIAAIITNPNIAVPLLRGLGYTAAQIGTVVKILKVVGGDVNNFPQKVLNQATAQNSTPKQ